MGKTSEAINSANVALSYDPNNAKALYRRGLAQLMKKDCAAAKADFERVLVLNPGDSAATERLRETAEVEKAEAEGEKKKFAKMFQ
jgi:cytochrome c-type biogenesis protein CcmH/NrfG